MSEQLGPFAKILCANDHDARCVEEMLSEALVQTRRFSGGAPEPTRHTLERILNNAKNMSDIRKLING